MTKLIVVEDHALVREGLVQTLRQIEDGVEIFAVADCGGANSLLEQEHQFDLMVLDLGLPDLRGDALALEVRRRRPDLPIVVATGHGADSLGALANLDRIAFVAKPYDAAALQTALDSLGIPTPPPQQSASEGA